MIKADRLPSGSYRCRVPYHDETGKLKYKSFTADTKKEAQLAAAAWESNHDSKSPQKDNPTVSEAMHRYVESKKNVLSPKTYREYSQMQEHAFPMLRDIPISELTQESVQQAVNDESGSIAPKTVRNRYGLLTATLAMLRPDFSLRITLPQMKKPDIVIPTESEIKDLLSEVKGTPLEIPILLAALCGMRRSEIAALKWDNVNLTDGTITVSEAIVCDIDNNLVTKLPKSKAGFRTLRILPPVLRALRAVPESERTGNVSSLNTYAIYNRYKTAMRKVTSTSYTLHELRHYCCSVMLYLGIPNKYIANYLGHETEDMVNRVYGHIMRDKTDVFYDRLSDYYKDL